MDEIITLMNSNDTPSMISGTERLRKMLSKTTDQIPFKTVIESGVVPRLIAFLDPLAPHLLIFEAAWCLSNLVCGKTADTILVMQYGTLSALIRLISLPEMSDDVKENCIWALGNLSSELEYRDEILNSGVLEKMLEMFNPSDVNVKLTKLRLLTWTISNICRVKPRPPVHLIIPTISVFKYIIYLEDVECVIDAAWGFSFITELEEGVHCVIETGVVPKMIELLASHSISVVVPLLRTVGNIATGQDRETDLLIEKGVLPKLMTLMNHEKKGIRKECFWTLSNIAAGTSSQIQHLISNGFFQLLVDVLLSPLEEDTNKREIVYTFNNATSGAIPIQIEFFVSLGFIPALTTYATSIFPKDEALVIQALEALQNILRTGHLNKTSANPNPYIAHCLKAKLPNLLLNIVNTCTNDELQRLAYIIIVQRFQNIYYPIPDDGLVTPQVWQYRDPSDMQWKNYDEQVHSKLEIYFTQHKNCAPIDSERFVDFSLRLERRYDDPTSTTSIPIRRGINDQPPNSNSPLSPDNLIQNGIQNLSLNNSNNNMG